MNIGLETNFDINPKLRENSIKIATWIGWEKNKRTNNPSFLITKYIDYDKGFLRKDAYYFSNTTYIPVSDFEFHSNANWLWICLDKISKDTNKSINEIFNTFKKIEDKYDLFNEIVNFIDNN